MYRSPFLNGVWTWRRDHTAANLRFATWKGLSTWLQPLDALVLLFTVVSRLLNRERGQAGASYAATQSLLPYSACQTRQPVSIKPRVKRTRWRVIGRPGSPRDWPSVRMMAWS